jgi:hypothetical protein
MIQPEVVRRKAENLYPKFLLAWLQADAFFPRLIRGEKRPDENLATAGALVRRLREGSKEVQGYGYTVDWAECNSRTHGRNLFPRRILFETQADFLRYIGKQREFAAFATAVDGIRSRYPELESWIRSNRRLLIESADQIEGVLSVIDYLRAHPRPELFARELPLPVDTKFIERNRCILREWLDRVLPPSGIRADEEHFERRYGLRYAEQHLLVRFLDQQTQLDCGCPWPECSIPLRTMAAASPIADRVLVVENKVNLLTLPQVKGALALGGLGNGVTDLRHLAWLSQRSIWYWGDLDVEGFAILARLRTIFPQTRSLLMDHETLCRWRQPLATSGSGRSVATPNNLIPSEQAAFAACAAANLRIEQERLPQSFVIESLRSEFE